MKTLLTSQEQRVRRLEEGFSAVRSSNLRIESLEFEIQEACQRVCSVSKKNENLLPGLLSKAQASSLRVKTVEFIVEHRLAEMDNKLQKIMEIGLNSRPLPRVVNNVNNTILHGAPSTVLEYVSLEIEEFAQARYADRIITEELTLEVLEIQDRINSSMMTPTTDFANKKKDSRQSENRSRERDIVRKGMERLEKEISQYTQVQVSKEQVDIALLQRCKTTDIPAVNLAITNIQKALEKYVGFNNIDSQYCDKVGEVMDKAQNWCLEI